MEPRTLSRSICSPSTLATNPVMTISSPCLVAAKGGAPKMNLASLNLPTNRLGAVPRSAAPTMEGFGAAIDLYGLWQSGQRRHA